MIRVLFFARVREQLGCGELEFDPSPLPATVGQLRAALTGRGEPWHSTLSEENLVCALNQQVVEETAALADGDEVAFYPPVTGG